MTARDSDSLRIVDCDVHPNLPQGIETLYPFMPEAWRQRFIQKGAAVAASAAPIRYRHPNGSVIRMDARTPGGGISGSDPQFLLDDLLEPHGIDLVLLNSLQAASNCGILSSLEESVVLASAFNDYFIAKWLSHDRRLRLAITIPSQDVQAAAAEVRRAGRHPQVAAVSVPLVNAAMGSRYWWPLYEAAQEMGLPVYVHPTGVENMYLGGPAVVAGVPNSYVERYLSSPLVAESNIISLMFSGTFEAFPRLPFIFAEFGFAWVIALLWRMDRVWRGLRHDVPWVKKSPIDYMPGHLRFTTQPIEEPDRPSDLVKMIDLIGPELLCFSTDYPHWDNDMPGRTLMGLPLETRQKIFSDNARAVLRLN